MQLSAVGTEERVESTQPWWSVESSRGDGHWTDREIVKTLLRAMECSVPKHVQRDMTWSREFKKGLSKYILILSKHVRWTVGMGWAGDGLGCEERCRWRLGYTGLRGTGLDRSAKIRVACLKDPSACSMGNRGGGGGDQGRETRPAVCLNSLGEKWGCLACVSWVRKANLKSYIKTELALGSGTQQLPPKQESQRKLH